MGAVNKKGTITNKASGQALKGLVRYVDYSTIEFQIDDTTQSNSFKVSEWDVKYALDLPTIPGAVIRLKGWYALYLNRNGQWQHIISDVVRDEAWISQIGERTGIEVLYAGVK